MELLAEFVRWCYWALNAGLPLLWHACWTVFCFGYKWADIVKASIRRYRRFVSGPSVKDRPPAERRWKMYETLWVTPTVVLDAKKEHEDGVGRLLHKWLEAFHAWCSWTATGSVTAEDGVVLDEGTVTATGTVVFIGTASSVLRWYETSSGGRSPMKMAVDRYAR
eukprot:jgi/Phyca11/12921/fgenesh1_pg.PHYCAscaffold_2_\